MKLKHKVSISVHEPDGYNVNVIEGGEVKLRERLLRWLFGEQKKVLVIALGNSVFNVEIKEHDFGKLFNDCLLESIDEKEDAGYENRAD